MKIKIVDDNEVYRFSKTQVIGTLVTLIVTAGTIYFALTGKPTMGCFPK